MPRSIKFPLKTFCADGSHGLIIVRGGDGKNGLVVTTSPYPTHGGQQMVGKLPTLPTEDPVDSLDAVKGAEG